MIKKISKSIKGSMHEMGHTRDELCSPNHCFHQGGRYFKFGKDKFKILIFILLAFY